MNVTPYNIAMRFAGLKEIKGVTDNPQILAMLKLDNNWPKDDETPWCSAFVNYVAWLLRLPRSKDLRARSWLGVGTPILLQEARADSDIVILKRGGGNQPGPEVMDAPGHVGFFAGFRAGAKHSIGASVYTGVESAPGKVQVLGGNQNDSVNITEFPVGLILGVRRLWG